MSRRRFKAKQSDARSRVKGSTFSFSPSLSPFSLSFSPSLSPFSLLPLSLADVLSLCSISPLVSSISPDRITRWWFLSATRPSTAGSTISMRQTGAVTLPRKSQIHRRLLSALSLCSSSLFTISRFISLCSSSSFFAFLQSLCFYLLFFSLISLYVHRHRILRHSERNQMTTLSRASLATPLFEQRSSWRRSSPRSILHRKCIQRKCIRSISISL
jgi:hypothetical protein